ncbi:MAG: hypothetical protein A2010_18535 [Nitrospirae bacterium GWD2_57_9]|nr:MAG: hypothetical protein A2010_18535 [Nitrospirae bacterium GWD2_57_9]OGW50772.1 MAG: hypothetical protein A2078_05700 [Nitrospirae bacterium GWC2_57_9]
MYKVIAFSLIYKGLFAASVSKPYAKLIETSEQMSFDMAERTRIEEALRESEERYRLIAENVSDVIWTLDIKTRRFTYVSPSVARLRGFTPEQVLAQPLDEVLTPSSLAEVMRRLEEVIPRIASGDAVRGGTPLEVEQPCKDGSTVWTEVTANIVRDCRGQPSAILGVSRNITERKRAEQALVESERRYRRLVETVTDYIYAARVENGEVAETTHSPGCTGVTGYGPDDFRADPLLWRRIIHEEDRQRVIEQLACLLRNEPAASLEHRVLHRDGSVRWVKHVAVPRQDEQGLLTAWDGLVSDITERKKLEDQLRQAQKMEAIGQLAGGIAHDFNNILSAIVGYGTLLQMKTEADDPLRANIDPILDAADRAANLTHSLLAFSRKQVLKPEPVDLNAIVQHVQRLLSRIMGEDIALTTRFWSDRVVVNADRGQIEQILMNLAANARDAMPNGGSFVIDTNNEELGEMTVLNQGAVTPGRYAVLTVADTGTGMDEATQKKVFDPFFTTKEPGKGTGLGLSMAYGIVKQHNGFITVASEPGRGTEFRIHLPLLDRAVEAEEPAEPAVFPGPAPSGTETVLVAEDDDTLRQLSQTVLKESGYRVIPACDGQDAVLQFRENAENIKIVLLDMIMPRMNGREAYEEIRKIDENVKVLFVSGYTADKENNREGFLDKLPFLNKPVLPRDLLKKVREVLDS